MSNFWQRLITGFFFVVILLGSILWSPYVFVALFFLICVLGLREYATLFANREHKPDVNVMMVGGGMLTLMWALKLLHEGDEFLKHYGLYFLIAVLAYPILSEWAKNGKASLTNIWLSLGGILYINIGFLAFACLRFAEPRYSDHDGATSVNGRLAIAFLLMLWSSDTFAYLTGRAFGKTPLAPTISPKKTWEGSIGGGICTIGVSILLFYTMDLHLKLFECIGMAAIIHVFGTFGDLAESKLKRFLGVKDSGTILPGHGGILDRFDSLLLAAPFTVAFLMICSMF